MSSYHVRASQGLVLVAVVVLSSCGAMYEENERYQQRQHELQMARIQAGGAYKPLQQQGTLSLYYDVGSSFRAATDFVAVPATLTSYDQNQAEISIDYNWEGVPVSLRGSTTLSTTHPGGAGQVNVVLTREVHGLPSGTFRTTSGGETQTGQWFWRAL